MNILIVESQILFGCSMQLYLQNQSFVSKVDFISDSFLAQARIKDGDYQAVLVRHEFFADLSRTVAEIQHSSSSRMALIVMAKKTSFARMRRAFQAGAMGYITNQAPPEDLISALQETTRGKLYCSSDLNHYLLQEWLGIRSNQKLSRQILSERERQVLAYYAQGVHLKRISEILGISASTIAVHKHNILRKLGLNSPAEVLAYCRDNDLLADVVEEVQDDEGFSGLNCELPQLH